MYQHISWHLLVFNCYQIHYKKDDGKQSSLNLSPLLPETREPYRRPLYSEGNRWEVTENPSLTDGVGVRSAVVGSSSFLDSVFVNETSWDRKGSPSL